MRIEWHIAQAVTSAGVVAVPVFDDDVRRLIEYSFRLPEISALSAFPMFSVQQVRAIYALDPAMRRKLLEALRERQRSFFQSLRPSSNDSLAHFIKPFHTHRNLAQEMKMREQAIDPSNR
jgi:hypothetical protein